MITGKPNVDPARMGYKVSADPEIVGMLIKPSFLFSFWVDLSSSIASPAELDTVLKETKRSPKEKYPEPITSSHEIGWYSRPLVTAHPSAPRLPFLEVLTHVPPPDAESQEICCEELRGHGLCKR
jgi:hypothetical protein